MKPFLNLWISVFVMAVFTVRPCNAEDGPPQISYVKMEWQGDIETAHKEALNVLKKAGYRVPAGQEVIFSGYGTLPPNSIAPTVTAHLMCSAVKHEGKNFTNVVIATSAPEMAQATTECGKLHEMMKQANGAGEVPGAEVTGQRLSMTTSAFPTGNSPPAAAGETLVYAHDVRTVYSGTMKNAVETAHRILEEMDLRPEGLDAGKLPELQAGSQTKDNLAALIATTSDEVNHNIQVHIFTAVRYHAPANAGHDQLAIALNTAKAVAMRYGTEMAHVMGGDAGNSTKPTHPK